MYLDYKIKEFVVLLIKVFLWAEVFAIEAFSVRIGLYKNFNWVEASVEHSLKNSLYKRSTTIHKKTSTK